VEKIVEGSVHKYLARSRAGPSLSSGRQDHGGELLAAKAQKCMPFTLFIVGEGIREKGNRICCRSGGAAAQAR